MRKKEHQNSGTLGKDTINKWIIPFLSVGKRFSFNKGAQPDVYFLDVTCIGILLLGFISKSLKKSLNRFIIFQVYSFHIPPINLDRFGTYHLVLTTLY